MTTLKYLGLPDLTGHAPDSLTPHLGYLDADAVGGYELVMPALRRGLHAWIRGSAPSDPTWTELQRLTDAVRGFSREILIHGHLRQHVLAGSRREPLVFRLDARRRRPYQFVIHSSLHEIHSTLHESVAAWLRTSHDDDVLVTLFPSETARHEVQAEIELEHALQQLSGNSPEDSTATSTRHVPAETAASAAARSEAIAGWLTAQEAGMQLPGRSGSPAQRASRLRRSGALFGVWVPEERAYRFAPWQFMQSGRPSPILPEILALMRGPNGVAAGERTSGWEELEWFLAPHALADGRTPAELLATDPPAILKVAHTDFDEGADDARW